MVKFCRLPDGINKTFLIYPNKTIICFSIKNWIKNLSNNFQIKVGEKRN
jgi:hypothetical protein